MSLGVILFMLRIIALYRYCNSNLIYVLLLSGTNEDQHVANHLLVASSALALQHVEASQAIWNHEEQSD